jgi:hypothetical protein|tara:strand:- start:334 stop:825 length:492 start_codon:yes stop_codon:yes gene_type:complete
LTDAEAMTAYDCAKDEMAAAYKMSGLPAAGQFMNWKNYANNPYPSATHGGRYVNNYGNDTARNYGRYENVGVLPTGSVLAKNSFGVNGAGKVMIGPLFLMEKMPAGFNTDFGDWRYSMVMPDGSIFGRTGGKGSAKVQFCADCHTALGAEQDHLLFMPPQYRM